MQTITYELLEKKFQSLAGLATLDATDKFFFLHNLNSRLRDAWDRIDWPDLIELKELPVISDLVADKTTDQIDYDILDAWDRNPYKDRSAVKVNYDLIDSRVILPKTYQNESVFVLSKKQFSDYSEGSTDIPRFFENYITSGVLSDFLRGDGQDQKANAEDSRSEEFLLRQIDRVEKLQQQNQPAVGVYPVNYPNGIIYQN